MADNTGKTAYILYKGGIQGEEPVDIRMEIGRASCRERVWSRV